MNEKAIAVVDAQPVALATMDYAPKAVMDEARKAATALTDVIKQKPRPVVINGETYLEYEDWQTVGRFYGVTAGIETEPEFVDIGGVQGFKATAVALRNGQVISRATAFCMKDEDRWTTAPTYQVASMAQTRACAKALRNVLSWVAVLAGYKPTPAEEMDGVRPAQRSGAPAGGGDKVPCPKCGKPAGPSKYPKANASHYCYGCKHGFVPAAGEPEDEPWTGDVEKG